MSDLLDRLRKRIYPNQWYQTVAIGALHGQANPQTVQSGTFTIGGPDKDLQEAVARIDALEANLTELLRLYDWRLKVGKSITKPEAIQYGEEKKAAWIEARRLLTGVTSGEREI